MLLHELGDDRVGFGSARAKRSVEKRLLLRLVRLIDVAIDVVEDETEAFEVRLFLACFEVAAEFLERRGQAPHCAVFGGKCFQRSGHVGQAALPR